MKFYDRQSELEELALLYRQASKAARMTVLTGRRRVGKTILALESAREQSCLYLFVSRKSEALLCAEYLDEIKRRFPVPVIGDIRTFKDVFALLVEVCRTQRLTVIIDEFQEFLSVNPAVYSEIQNLWDLNKASCKMNLILIGSVYSLMHRIFQDNKEPLFGRADRFMILKSFGIVAVISGIICFIYFMFPAFVMHALFGRSYDLGIRNLGLMGVFLTVYSCAYIIVLSALATAKKYIWIPVTIAAITQIIIITLIHTDVRQIIYINLAVSTFLLVGSLAVLKSHE